VVFGSESTFQQHHGVHFDAHAPRDGHSNCSGDFLGIAGPVRLHFVRDGEQLAAILFERKGGGLMRAQTGVRANHRGLDVLRVIIRAADDDQVFQTPRDDEIIVDKAA